MVAAAPEQLLSFGILMVSGRALDVRPSHRQTHALFSSLLVSSASSLLSSERV